MNRFLSEKVILCRNNEIWIDCKTGYCKPQTCKDRNTTLACPQIADPCPGGCICKDGFLRDDSGDCIPIDQCRKYSIYLRKFEPLLVCL